MRHYEWTMKCCHKEGFMYEGVSRSLLFQKWRLNHDSYICFWLNGWREFVLNGRPMWPLHLLTKLMSSNWESLWACLLQIYSLFTSTHVAQNCAPQLASSSTRPLTKAGGYYTTRWRAHQYRATLLSIVCSMRIWRRLVRFSSIFVSLQLLQSYRIVLF